VREGWLGKGNRGLSLRFQSFNLRLDKLLELNFYGDGVRLTDDKGKPRVVKFASEGNTDVVGATLSFAINQFAG